MIATARSHGMLVMCGCMIETSLGITAAAHFAPLLDYADFDGAALLVGRSVRRRDDRRRTHRDSDCSGAGRTRTGRQAGHPRRLSVTPKS